MSKQYKKNRLRLLGRTGDPGQRIPWLTEHYGAEIITYTGDLGQGEDLAAIKNKALITGASHAVVDDLTDRFVEEFIFGQRSEPAHLRGHVPHAHRTGTPSVVRPTRRGGFGARR